MNQHRPIDEDDALIGPVPLKASEPEPMLAPQPTPMAAAAPPPPRRSIAGRLLTLLVVLLIGTAGGLIGGPRLAPMLPAPVAAWLAPTTTGVDAAALAAMERSLRTELTALGQQVQQAEQTAEDAASAAAAARDAIVERDPLTADLGNRIDAVQGEIDALSQAVTAGAGSGGDALSSALAEELRLEMEALSAEVAARPAGEGSAGGGDPAVAEALQARIAALEEAMERDIDLRERAFDEADSARRDATIATALAEVDRAMALGEPFPEALETLSAVVDDALPIVLVEAAGQGVATREALQASFNTAAYEAVAEALAHGEDEGVQSVLARVQARFTGIPTEPEAGDGTPAVLSRARHELLQGHLAGALKELEALPTEAQTAMADWVARARTRHDSDEALHDLRVTLGER